MGIVLKSPEEIRQIENANRLLHSILDGLMYFVCEGRTSIQIAERFEAMVRQRGARAAFKNYQRTPESKPFPSACCVSVNSVLTHGVPDGRFLRAGDLIKIDAGLELGGWHADAARSIAIEPSSHDAQRAAAAAKEICLAVVAQCHPGAKWGDVRAVALAAAAELNVSIVPDVAGHGIGRKLHEAPSLPLALDRPSDVDELVLREGMVLAIEPVICLGAPKLVRGVDGFGLETADGSLGAHYEECIVIESRGPRRLRGE